MAKIITISGLAGAGKDTLAVYLKELFPWAYVTRFAAPLKTASRAVFEPGFDERDRKEVPVNVPWGYLMDGVYLCFKALKLPLPSPEAVRQALIEAEVPVRGERWVTISPRHYQQILGTDLVRKTKASAFTQRIIDAGLRHEKVIVTDCRFENELAVSTTPVFVYRPKHLLEPVVAHESEKMALRLSAEYEAHDTGYISTMQAFGRTFEVVNNLYGLDYLKDEATLINV